MAMPHVQQGLERGGYHRDIGLHTDRCLELPGILGSLGTLKKDGEEGEVSESKCDTCLDQEAEELEGVIVPTPYELVSMVFQLLT
ncbi:hypothetical protein Y1Q_0017778 [Alligator mississippiensis]|uniref:Uncharacterized protein n=1 Tax=Alligator mississippiensis TaxID=8496 RepID=A0A151MJI7_ALLMI|nr:hypothetical protein Y1Q_0017778 [Alligator mississippiensis]